MNQAGIHSAPRRSFRLCRFFFLGCLFTLFPILLASQTSDLRLSSGTGETIHVQPGALLVVPVTFQNMGSKELSLSTSIVLPDGWKMVGSFPRLTLLPQGKELYLVSLMVPRTAPARSYSILVASGVTGELTPPAVLRVAIAVDIVRRLEVIAAEAPRFVVAGQPATFVYEVRNRGNDTAQVRFTGWNSRQYATVVTPTSARIAPMTTTRVVVDVATSADDRSRGTLTTELLTRPTTGTDVRMAASSELVPRSGSSESRQLTFPIIMSLRGATENERRGLQGEFLGTGSLREDKKDRLEFVLRSPETQTRSVLGQRDEYRAKYAVDDHEVYAGDWNYALSPLTEVGRSAVGLGGRTHWKRLNAGGYVNQTRFGPPIRKQAGGWLRYDIHDDLSTGVQVLHQADDRTSDIVSLSLTGSPLQRVRMELEGGASTGPGRTGTAIFARLNGSLPWMSYDLRTVNASPEYAGYYRDLQFTTVSLVAYATQTLRLEVSGNLQSRNARLDTSQRSAPRASFLQLGVGYANLITLSYRSSGVLDTLSRSPYDRREDVLQVRTSQTFGRLSLSAYADLGTLTDHRLGTAAAVRRASISASGQLTPQQLYGATMEISRTPDPSTGTQLDRLSGTLTASYVLGPRTLASLNAFGSRLSGSVSQAFGVIDASVEHSFPNSHRVKFLARRSTFTGVTPEFAMAAEYAVPIAVPFAKATSTGIVDGRVIEQTGEGVPGVFVTLGSFAAVTDERGGFVFADVTPGPHVLSIDRGSAGLQRIASVPLPLSLNVVGGARLPVEITLLPSATIEVFLDRYEHGPMAEDGTAPLLRTPMDGYVRVPVELRRGPEVVRSITDRNGRARFVDLPPGQWTLSFDTGEMTDGRIETAAIDFQVTPGARIDTTVRFLPRRRSVRIIEEGGVLQAPSSGLNGEERFGAYVLRPSGTGVVVQVSSWSRMSQARRDMDRVAAKTGRPVRVERTSLPDKKVVFRVTAGPFPSAEAAREFCRMLGE